MVKRRGFRVDCWCIRYPFSGDGGGEGTLPKLLTLVSLDVSPWALAVKTMTWNILPFLPKFWGGGGKIMRKSKECRRGSRQMFSGTIPILS